VTLPPSAEGHEESNQWGAGETNEKKAENETISHTFYDRDEDGHPHSLVENKNS